MYTYNVKEKGAKGTVRVNADYDGSDSVAGGQPQEEWHPIARLAFRITFIFFAILIVPWHPAFYRQLFSIDWLHPHFKHLLDLTTFLPQLVDTERWGTSSYFNYIIYLAVAGVTAYVWGKVDKSKEHTLLYYLLRAGLRYKLGLGLIACGFYLFFQQQMPYPSLSNLHTNYGDMFAWKLYYQTTAINPEYQSFLGFVEILGGILLLYRPTVTLAAGLVIGFVGNVAMVNSFYDVGHHLYATFLMLSAVFLLSYDVPRLWSLLVQSKRTVANRFHPDWKKLKLAGVRTGLRLLSLVLILLSGARAFALVDHPYKIPQQPGIPGAYGYYVPTLFKLNGEEVPYSTTDPNRWQDVIFEKWSTISIRANRPLRADASDGDVVSSLDIDRNYETAGSGGRHYFHYELDSVKQVIKLQNKNPNHRGERMDLRYSYANDSTLVLKGVNENSDSIYTELRRIRKKYFMYEGRRSSIKL